MIILKWIYQIALASCFLISYVTTSSCKKEYTDRSGYISSESGSCNYQIEVGYADWIKLRFTRFDVKGDMPGCSTDRVEIWSGCSNYDYGKHKLATFCSSNMVSNLPHDIYTKERCVEIRLVTENGKSSTSAFSLSYSSGTGQAGISSSCNSKKDLHGSSGIMASPRWPKQFGRTDLPSYLRDCEWDIETSSSNFIQINAMDVDFAGSGGYCAYKNHLKIKGKKSVVSSTLSSSYCSRRDPFTLNTKFYELDVELKGYYSPRSSERGFVLGYVVYRDDEAVSATKWYTVASIVIIVVIASTVAFCCFRKYRARRSRASQQSVSTNYGSGNPSNNVTQAPNTMPLVKQGGYPQQPMGAAPQQPYAPPPPQQPYPGAPPQQFPGAPPQQYPGAPPQQYPGAPPPQYPPQQYPPQQYPDAPPPYPGPAMGVAPYPPMAQPYPVAPAPYPPPS